MRDSESPQLSVVVGIDGSRWAMDAALWAVDEAVSRDIPLRLVYAIESSSVDPHNAARALANGEFAVRYAFTAVESTGKPVKIEVEIVQRGPVGVLLEASRSAAMVCVGSAGVHHATRGRIGSTASALAASAHCPVAVVHRRADATQAQPGSVLVVLDTFSASNAVLERGLEEARLRGAPLRVLAERPAKASTGHAVGDIAHENHWAHAELDRRLTQWRRRYPDLDITAEDLQDNMLNYLQSNAGSVQLAVVGSRGPHALDALFGPAGRSTLDQFGCTVLICNPRSGL